MDYNLSLYLDLYRKDDLSGGGGKYFILKAQYIKGKFSAI